MGLGNGMPLRMRTSYIRIGNNLDCVEGVTCLVLMWNSFMCDMTHSRWRVSFMRNMTLSYVKYCIRIHICKYVNMYTYIYVCTNLSVVQGHHALELCCHSRIWLQRLGLWRAWMSVQARMRICIRIRVRKCVYICMYACMHVCTYVCVYAYICVHICSR